MLNPRMEAIVKVRYERCSIVHDGILVLVYLLIEGEIKVRLDNMTRFKNYPKPIPSFRFLILVPGRASKFPKPVLPNNNLFTEYSPITTSSV